MSEFSAKQIAATPILQYFSYSHLPMNLQGVSSAFCALASSVVESVPAGTERTVALRKLLEAKDAAVRASVPAKLKPQTFYDRLLAESQELEARKSKLYDFTRSLGFLDLPPDQRKLMHEQFVAMDTYAQVLGQRINLIMQGTQGQATASEQIDENVRITGGGHSEEALPFNG